jgi:arylsulfatase A-like enzyme
VGGKMDLLEGGIRVPYIARWPERIRAGGTTAQLAITMDWTATMLEAAGVAQHPDYPMDGRNLLRVLERPEEAFARELYWRMKFRNQKAMRSGDWKWLSLDGDEFLYDLSRDARERANLGAREPERLAAMRERYAAWERQLPAFPDATYSVPATRADLAKPS